MAYIGRAPVNGFHAKQTLSTDGSTTTFTLDFTVADETSLIVSVGGVLQEPKVLSWMALQPISSLYLLELQTPKRMKVYRYLQWMDKLVDSRKSH